MPKPFDSTVLIDVRNPLMGAIRVTVSEDPLGTVNQILGLYWGTKLLKARLIPRTKVDDVINFSREGGLGFGYGMSWDGKLHPPTWSEPTYVVKVNDKIVLEVPESETWKQGKPKKIKTLKWRWRLLKTYARHPKSIVDLGFKKLGYEPIDEYRYDE